MSLRRKIALWLCPELGEVQVEYYPSAEGWARDTLGNAKSATDAAWKAEMLDQLKALNANMVQVTEGGNAMRCEVVNRVREH